MKQVIVVCACTIALTCIASAQRLPDIAAPDHYKLTLTPDLVKETFSGGEVIRVRVLKPTSEIVINAADINFEDVSVTSGGATQKAKVSLDKEKEQATLALDKQLQPGPATIEIKYTGTLNHDMRGFYIGKQDNGQKYAATQLEATDARRAFPSFDEPAYKATFDITVVADKGMTVISNTKPVSDEAGPLQGKHTVRFATTPKMSCYLVAIVVGDFEYIEGSADGIPIRVYASPGKKQLGTFALDAAENIMAYYNRYFAIKYPYGKLDLVGLPDFSPGAMENTCCITFRELLLLLDEKNAAIDLKKTVASVIAHEMAHQWFGDLVTMEWWNDFWLNEGFATWMSSKPVEAWKPEWQIDLSDVRDTTNSLDADSLQNTHPIHQEAQTPGEILELADEITYGKTAAVLRMLESYLGPETFRAGVNAYLKQHAYANATAADFWGAQTRISKKPVDKIMPTFVEQAGAPFVSVKSQCSDGSEQVSLAQQRYFFDRAKFEAGTNELWQIPICLQASTSTKSAPPTCELLTQKQRSFSLSACSPWVDANAGARGFYRSGYESQAVHAMAKDAETALSPAERIMLLADVWASVRVDREEISDYLFLADGLQSDRNANVLGQLIDQLNFIGRYLLSDTDRESYNLWLRQLLNPIARDVGWQKKPGESPEEDSLRASLMHGLGYTARDPQVQALARKMAEQALQDPSSVDHELAFEAFPVAAYNGDATFYDEVLAHLKTAKTPEEQLMYQRTLASFNDPKLLERTLEYALGPDTRSQDSLLLVSEVMRNPAGEKVAWDFARDHWTDIEKLGGPFASAILVHTTGSFCSAEMLDQVKSFFAGRTMPAAERTFKQSLERINYCVDLKQQQGAQLASWLQHQGASVGN
jgi:aminopeptidase N